MEAYLWVAETFDGKILKESETPLRNVLDLNKKGKIKYFLLQPQRDGLKRVLIKLGGKRKLIFWRRRIHHHSSELKLQWTLTIAGWEENVKGVSVKSKVFIYPNGAIEFNNDEPTLVETYHERLIQLAKKEN